MYLKIENNIPKKYTIEALRKYNSNISFPEVISESTLSEFSVYPYTLDDKPEYNSLTQYLQQGDFYQDSIGNWKQGWDIVDKPVEVVSQIIRSKRDDLLSQTDWTALSDVTMSEEMKIYRQALRDLPQQSGFPYNVVWPSLTV